MHFLSCAIGIACVQGSFISFGALTGLDCATVIQTVNRRNATFLNKSRVQRDSSPSTGPGGLLSRSVGRACLGTQRDTVELTLPLGTGRRV